MTRHLMLLLLTMSFFCCSDTKENSGTDMQDDTPTQQTDDTPIIEEDDSPSPSIDSVLIFTKTAGFRHASIEKGVQTIVALGGENDFEVIQTESGEDFNEGNLSKYALVIFLSTTMDVLNDDQQAVFESYINNGGSYFGIHSATDTEYEWPWYGELVGAYFDSHPNNPNVRSAEIELLDNTHPSTSHLPEVWTRNDEWYNFQDINPNITVLLNLDETSYEGGTNGEDHPIAWYHEFDGGRSFYTGGGHTNESFDEPNFRQHLLGAIEWCLKR